MGNIYTYRKSALEKPQSWELSDQGISCRQEKGTNIQISYPEIESLRLFYHPNNRYRLNNYCCKITLKNQATYNIYSCTYKGIADFGNQAETYIPFVKELVQRTKAANPDCEIQTGHTPLTYYGNIVFVIVAILAVFLIFSVFPDGYKNGFVVVKLIVIGFLGIYLAKSIRVNKPRLIFGTEIPNNVLPQIPGTDHTDKETQSINTELKNVHHINTTKIKSTNRKLKLKIKITKNDLLFTLATFFALWFSAVGIIWFYGVALFCAYPFGIISFLIWRNIRKDGKKRNIAIPIILIIGLLSSLGFLAYILISES
ncbi:MAG: hypothetical protein J5I50_12630 [Chitinophagaceae bacterium]|nr:hypothetical protein [Chitinophagaceae bacterium]